MDDFGDWDTNNNDSGNEIMGYTRQLSYLLGRVGWTSLRLTVPKANYH